MKIEDLKKGDVFYNADMVNFTWYEYLMPMIVKNPKNEGMYHIIINQKTHEPERIYKDRLQDILNKKLFTMKDTRLYQIKLTKEWLEYLKKEK